MLLDARLYAARRLDQEVSGYELPGSFSEEDIETACAKIRSRLTVRIWDDFIPRQRNYADFRLTFAEFDKALWEEGVSRPGDFSLEELTVEALTDRAEAMKPEGKADVASASIHTDRQEAEGGTQVSQPDPSGKSKARRTRGPQRDYETAEKVVNVIAKVTGVGANWRAKLDEICDALDEANVARPKTWKRKGYDSWFDCLSAERTLVVKAVEHHQQRARERKTFS